MTSLVYIFSKFTSEALFIEALLISLLCVGYATFWILNKRKYGVIDQDVPSGVVKDYLAHLIIDAEQLKVQLFGLLNSTRASGAELPRFDASTLGLGSVSMATGDPAFSEKLRELEEKLAEKETALNGIVEEKERIMSELQQAKDASANSSGAGGGDNSDLLEKIKMLEARLAEYSVIEDDLANLKRLQQENTQLKQQLSQAASAAPAAPAPAAPIPAPEASEQQSNVDALFDAALTEVAPAAPAPESTEQSNVDALFDAALTEAAPEAPPAAEISDAADPQAAVDSMFESLMNDVAAPAAEAAPAAPEVAAPAPVSAKSDEELVAEFEKMLNS